MFLAVGVGAYVAAVFHMIMHAFFKGLLFLGSGSVIHGMHDEQDMRRMGRLAKFLPWTAWTFIVGWLAIAGIPPFSGFWSKDAILLGVWNDNKALWVIGVLTAGLTAFYMSRQVFMVFYGKARWEDARPDVEAAESEAGSVDAGHGHGAFRPHESGWLMVGPLVVLALLSTVGGVINLPFSPQTEHLARWLEPVVGGVEADIDFPFSTEFALAAVTTVLCLVGIFAAYRIYLRQKVAAEKVERAPLAHAWYVDEELTAFVGGPGMEAFEKTSWFDRNVIDGAVNGLAWLTRAGGRSLRHLQTGYVRNYALGVAVGAVILVGLLLGRA
jgi:NADH-quinone oxidoreductase subunit L